MLAVAGFVAFWILLALVLFFIAARGGVRGARETLQTQSHGGRRAAGVIFTIMYIGFGVAIPLAVLTGNRANASKQILGIRLTAAEKRGRTLFGENCGVCHTLSAANAIGKVGPNLDTLKPPATLVLNTINNGCLQSPPSGSPSTCLGQGTMPSQIVQGRDAQDVADFVGRVAGKS